MDLNNIPLIEYAAKKNKPVILSTGLGGLSDINNAVECLEQNGCHEIILLHCVSIYPPSNDEVHLNQIDMLRNYYHYPIGYSDHTIGITAPIMSMAKGVCVIEKHFTIDKGMFGWDHKISADPNELKMIVDAAKEAYKMNGSYRKVVSESIERQEAFKRSIVATRDIRAGQLINMDDMDFKRPGIGIEPKYYTFIEGKVAKRDIKKDSIIMLEDF